MDYYGFQKALYELKFRSKGDAAVSQRVVQLFKDASIYPTVVVGVINLTCRRLDTWRGRHQSLNRGGKMGVAMQVLDSTMEYSYLSGLCSAKSSWKSRLYRCPLILL